MQTMKFNWVTKGGLTEGVNAFLNPYIRFIKNSNSRWDGWETRKIQYYLKVILVTIRATEIDYDKEQIEKVPHPWYAYNSVKYEVKPNRYGIEQILYLKGQGWFVAGENLELWRVYQ